MVILVSSSSVTAVMKDFSAWTGELGGSMSDIKAAELGVAAMVWELKKSPRSGAVRKNCRLDCALARLLEALQFIDAAAVRPARGGYAKRACRRERLNVVCGVQV